MEKFKKQISKLGLIISIFSFALPLATITYAQRAVIPDIQRIEDIYNLVKKAALWFQVFFFVLAAIFIIMAAFSYLRAGGDEKKLEQAKNQIIYAIIAIVVALLAFVMKAIVKNFLGGGSEIML